eukprot:scaffold15277_cov129-Isochrysis_galbana.AAC.1
MTRLLSALHAEWPSLTAGSAPDGVREYHRPEEGDVKWNAWTSFMPTRLDDWPPKMTMPFGSDVTKGSGINVDVWRMRVGGGEPELETPAAATKMPLVATVTICQVGAERMRLSNQTVCAVSGVNGGVVSLMDDDPPYKYARVFSTAVRLAPRRLCGMLPAGLLLLHAPFATLYTHRSL